MPLPLFAALLPAAFQAVQGISQRSEADNLKESKFIPPELLMKRDLARQQAYSKRAPGTAQAEEQVRRNLATSLSASRRAFGGDAGKMAAITSSLQGQANDATQTLQSRGQAFSEGAVAREGQALSEIGAVKQRNRENYNRTKAELYRASDQNLFGAVSNVGSFALAGGFDGIDPSLKADAKSAIEYGESLKRGGKPLAIERADYDPSLPTTPIGPVKIPGYPSTYKSGVTPEEALKRLRGDYAKAAKGKVRDTMAMGDEYIKSGKQALKQARRDKWKGVSSTLTPWSMGGGGFPPGNDYEDYVRWKMNTGRGW